MASLRPWNVSALSRVRVATPRNGRHSRLRAPRPLSRVRTGGQHLFPAGLSGKFGTRGSAGSPFFSSSIRWASSLVEWTVRLRNEGKIDTPIIEQVQALDRSFKRGDEGGFLLHHNVGSPTNRTDFARIETPLPPNAEQHCGATDGRPNSRDLSFFSLDWGKSGNVGTWEVDGKRLPNGLKAISDHAKAKGLKTLV